ncbi:MAG TPA: aromatic ring-opening dioxygenase LigA [Acidimicrobiia bacterium]
MSGPEVRGIRTMALVVGAVGAARAAAGVAAWGTVRSQLASERIVVPAAGGRWAGRTVKGPLVAFAEAEAIRKIALGATGGRTYGEMEEGDPLAETAMEASLLRSSLFTSIVAFGVAAGEVALGGVLMVIAVAMARLGRRPSC